MGNLKIVNDWDRDWPIKTVGITGLKKNFGRDGGIEEQYWGPSYCTCFGHSTTLHPQALSPVAELPQCNRRGVNRGMEIHRSVLFFGPNPSIRCYLCSNPDPHCVYSYCGIRLLQ